MTPHEKAISDIRACAVRVLCAHGLDTPQMMAVRFLCDDPDFLAALAVESITAYDVAAQIEHARTDARYTGPRCEADR